MKFKIEYEFKFGLELELNFELATLNSVLIDNDMFDRQSRFMLGASSTVKMSAK